MDALATEWQRIFQNHLVPLKNRNPNRPVLFLEFGYTDAVAAPTNPSADEFAAKVFTAQNGNGLDDGEETQANVVEAFFPYTLDAHGQAVQGAFLWGHDTAGDADWTSVYGQMRTFAVRQKRAGEVVKNQHTFYASIHDAAMGGPPSRPCCSAGIPILSTPPPGYRFGSRIPAVRW